MALIPFVFIENLKDAIIFAEFVLVLGNLQTLSLSLGIAANCVCHPRNESDGLANTLPDCGTRLLPRGRVYLALFGGEAEVRIQTFPMTAVWQHL